MGVIVKDTDGNVLLDCDLAADWRTPVNADRAAVIFPVAVENIRKVANLTDFIFDKAPVTIEIGRRVYSDFSLTGVEMANVTERGVQKPGDGIATVIAVLRREPTKKDIDAWYGFAEEGE